EERPALLGSQEAQAQPVRLQCQRVVGLDAGQRVLVEIAARLVEELARERDVAIVDEEHLAQVRDIGDTIRVARGDDARHDALKTAPEIGGPDRRAHPRPVAPSPRAGGPGESRAPAFGPGDCSKISSTWSSMANAGQYVTVRVMRRGTPILSSPSP